MAALSISSKALVNVAFAGISAGLFARGALIMAAAGPLSRMPTGPANERIVGGGGKNGPKRMAIPPFPQLAPEIEEKVAPELEQDDTVEPTGGPLVPINADVVAIVWYSQAEWSTTTVIMGGESTVHSVNTCAAESRKPCNVLQEGYKVAAILPDRIKVLHEQSGQFQEIELRASGKKPQIAKAAAEPEAPKTDTRGKGSAISKMMDNVKQTGPNSWEAPPGMREDVLGRLNEVAMEGRWLPYFEGGKIVGFKLAQTVSNSAFEKIGLKAGDVIRSVNGYDISSPDKMLDVFTKLRDARDLSVDIQRGGDSKNRTRLNYTIN